MIRVSLFALVAPLLIPVAWACHPVNTVPPPLSPADRVEYYDLEISAALEIKAVDFDAMSFSWTLHPFRLRGGTDAKTGPLLLISAPPQGPAPTRSGAPSRNPHRP